MNPARVKLVAEALAELKQMSYEALAEVTMTNAKTLFDIEK